MRDACKLLKDLGQDVQLHTHPGWRIDKRDSIKLQNLKLSNSYLCSRKDFMTKLCLNEQIDILNHGKDIINDWIGTEVIAHRSGGYSINENTVKALKNVGIKIDSSMQILHPNCHFNFSKNSLYNKDGLIEIPVTVAEFYLKSNVFHSKDLYRSIQKTDFVFFESNELSRFYDESIKNKANLLNLFFHSYSLLNYDQSFKYFKVSKKLVFKLEEMIDWAVNLNQAEVLSCSQFQEKYSSNKEVFEAKDFIPRIPLKKSKIIKYISKKLRNILKC